MTNPRTLRVKNPTDLLAMVPYAFGFHPDESLVLCALDPGGVHARVDLPREESHVPEVLAGILTAAARQAPGRVALVAYTEDHALALDTVQRAREALAELGVDVLEAVRADGVRWFSLTGCDGPCCPAEGTAYDLSSHLFTAELVLDGRVTLRSRQALADSLSPDPAAVEEVRAAVGDLADRCSVHELMAGDSRDDAGWERLVAEGRWVRARVRRFLETHEPLDTEEVGRLVVGLESIEVRDVAWSEMSRANAESHVDLWRDVVRRTPLELLAPPAALLAFAAWLTGDGALAWCAVERCQEAQPDYSLAALLTHALASAIPPSTWTPFPAGELPLFAG